MTRMLLLVTPVELDLIGQAIPLELWEGQSIIAAVGKVSALFSC